MAYSLCFICTNKILGFFESSKKQTAAGTLCELLQIQLRDSTFTFPPKLQQAPYCTECVQTLKEVHQMINNLRELEQQIQDVRKEVENNLKKSCEKRRSVGNVNNSDNDGDSHSEDEHSFHPLDQFREDVVKEVDPNLVSSKNILEMKLNLKKTPTLTKKFVIESSKSLKLKLPELNSSRSIKTKSLHLKSSLEETLPENFNEGVQAVSTEKITLDSVSSNVPIDICYQYEDQHILGLENDLSTGFISNMAITKTEGIQESQNSGSDVEDIDNLDDANEIFVDATSDGRFQCPHAPICKETFLPAEKANFLNHVHLFHKGKIPKTTKNLPVVVEMETLFACNFCEKAYSTTKRLKDHHIKHHDDEEWFPGHETVKKKLIVSTSGKVSSVGRATRRVKDDNSNRRTHKCTYCDAMFTRAYHLVNHMRRHTGDKPYKCKECPEAFHTSTILRSHLFKAHGIGTHFECDNCKVKYVYQYQLTGHQKSCLGKKN